MENRDCPSILYSFDTIAKVGDLGMTGFGDSPSLSKGGTVAFIGQFSDGQSMVTGNGSPSGGLVDWMSLMHRGLVYGRSIRVGNAVLLQAAVRLTIDRETGTYIIRPYGPGGIFFQKLVSTGQQFDTISEFTDIANNLSSDWVFVGHTNHGWTVATPQSGGSFNTFSDPGLEGARPSITDTDQVLVRTGQGSSSSLRLFSYDFSSSTEIAGADMGFTRLGASPGITADGSIVAFYGEVDADGATRLHLDPGPGIFVSATTPSGRVIRRVAGVAGNGYLDPGETYADTDGIRGFNATSETDEGPVAGFDSDNSISIASARTGDSEATTVAFIGFDSQDAKTVYSVLIDTSTPATGRVVDVTDLTRVVGVGGSIHPDGTPAGTMRTIHDVSIYHAVNALGQVAFWADTDQGQAILRANPLRKPVLILPGIAGTFPVNPVLLGSVGDWYLQRGIGPDALQIDPLSHAYDDLIQTFRNAGYVEGQDLFIVKYDWRVLPGPIDGTSDGFISGLDAPSITSRDGGIRNLYRYGVDYLGHYLKAAVDAWDAQHPGVPLDSVDIVAHSTGGLVVRSYIQSGAYNGVFDGVHRLPKVDKFVMLAVPNQGASKAWNPLHDNWAVAPADDRLSFEYVLSKTIDDAYEKLLAGYTIVGPDRNIRLADVTTPGGELDKLKLISLYAPTIGALLATYNFLDRETGTLTNVNSDPLFRNAFLLDLNGGPDPNAFARSVGRVLDVHGNGVLTPNTVVQKYETNIIDDPSDPQFSFTDLQERNLPAGAIYFHDVLTLAGDGTVPLVSLEGQFLGDPRITFQRFFTGANTQGNVSHTGIISNPDVQRTILNDFGFEFYSFGLFIDPSGISTGLATYGYRNIVTLVVDPVESILTDAQGRRLGYSQATGVLTEIPGSVFLGRQDALGFIIGPVEGPLRLDLNGLGGRSYFEVSGVQGGAPVDFVSDEELAIGEHRTFAISFTPPSRTTPVISWNCPSPITYGTPLGAAQLDATATVDGVPIPGTFTYAAGAGTVLHAGLGQALGVAFTPSDAVRYTTATGSTTIDVLRATPVLAATGAHVNYDGNPHPASARIRGVNGDDLGSALVITYNGSRVVPVDAGAYAVAVSFPGSGDYNPIRDASSQVIIDQLLPAFSGLSVPTIVVGTPSTLLSGVLQLGPFAPKANVTITLNGVTQMAPIRNGSFSSTFTTTSLAPGSYTITYSYPGDVNFKAVTTSATLVVTYNAPVVLNVMRFGIHYQPTYIVLVFNEALDSARSQNVWNYEVLSRGFDGRFGSKGSRRIGIDFALYDPTTHSVILRPHQRLSLHRAFQLTVNGVSPSALTDRSGRLLDGKRSGRPGSNFVTVLDRQKLALGVPAPKALTEEPKLN